MIPNSPVSNIFETPDFPDLRSVSDYDINLDRKVIVFSWALTRKKSTRYFTFRIKADNEESENNKSELLRMAKHMFWRQLGAA